MAVPPGRANCSWNRASDRVERFTSLRVVNSMTRHRTVIVIVSLIGLFLGGCSDDEHRRAEFVDATQTNAEDIVWLSDRAAAARRTKTDVFPHPFGKIVRGRNYVFCATFKLAWDRAASEGQTEPLYETPFSEGLRLLRFRESDLSSDCFVAVYDAPEACLAAVRERFPGANAELPQDTASDTPMAFSYLRKALPFQEAFDRLNDPLEFKGSSETSPVSAFGYKDFQESNQRNTLHRRQITILDYQDDDDFVIRLNTTSENDRVILAKVLPSDTLYATVRAVQARVKNGYPERDERSQVQDGEAFIIPIVSLHLLRKFRELTRRGADPVLGAQMIRFRLDEKGAILESYAHYLSLGSEAPRKFVIDRPFLLYLQQNDSDEPYLAVWVENAEVLEAFDTG
jgi:hypothetical protein